MQHPARVRFMIAFFRLLLNLLTERHIAGRENIPERGPYIVVANHLSFLDAPVLYEVVGGPQLSGWAAEKWERNLVFGTILRTMGIHFIQRGLVDRSALDFAVEWLRSGGTFGMSPEGTRSQSGALNQAKTGVAYIAHHSGASILPIAHHGTERAMRSLLRLRRQRIDVTVGRLFSLPPLDPDDRAASLRRNADEVMCHLAALLPPSYRGFYADHPRTQALLASGEA
ncbi:MAG TPA: lysophospholipid acyltransferase family protein [Anaerolineales bacterium]|nr:lysophospholipid acyltransferase family protein [Anaerolineales bacterium]